MPDSAQTTWDYHGGCVGQPRCSHRVLHGGDPRRTWGCARAPGRTGHVMVDEFHYYADKERGTPGSAPPHALGATFLLMSRDLRRHRAFREATHGTHGATRPWSNRGSARCRSTIEYRETPLHETVLDLVKKGRPDIPRELHPALRRRRGAEPDEHRLVHQGREDARLATRCSALA